MKRIISAFALILPAVTVAAAQKNEKSVEEVFMTIEKQAWNIFGKGSGQFFEGFWADNFVLVD